MEMSASSGVKAGGQQRLHEHHPYPSTLGLTSDSLGKRPPASNTTDDRRQTTDDRRQTRRYTRWRGLKWTLGRAIRPKILTTIDHQSITWSRCDDRSFTT